MKRFFWLRRREDIAREVNAELSLHIELKTEELIAQGMTQEKARQEAEESFGNFETVRRECTNFGIKHLSSERRNEIMNEFIQDSRYGIRIATKKPLFSLVIILTLALGIGVNAAIFSIVNGVLLRPLPYHDPDQLVRVWGANIASGRRYLEISYPDYLQWKEAAVFSTTAAFSRAPRILQDVYGEPKNITIARISDDLFSVLGVQPVIGRNFLNEEYRSGEAVVILSDRLWRTRYHADPGILGRTITIDKDGHTVVGVMPADYDYPGEVELWRPLTDDEKEEDDPELFMIARLAPGVTVEKASAEVELLSQRMQKEKHIMAWAQSMHGMLVREVKTPILALFGAVSFVLLIACANIANLLLARGTARSEELSVRKALGAGPGRIVRQLLTESLVLAIAGGLLGIVCGYWALKGIINILPQDLPRIGEVVLSWRVIGAMSIVTIVAGLGFGLAPAFYATKQSSIGSGRYSQEESKHRLQKILVIGQIALATVLVIGSGLLIHSFLRLISYDRGFNAENVLIVPLNMRGDQDPAFVSFYDQALEKVKELPGVKSAALSLRTPMEPIGFKIPFSLQAAPEQNGSTMIRPITPEYFKVAGIRLLTGREFDERDHANAPAVAIANEAFASAFMPGRDPVGQNLSMELDMQKNILIVGVVQDVRPDTITDAGPELYLPFHQTPMPGMQMLIRITGDPRNYIAPIRERIHALRPNIPLDKLYMLEQRVSETLAPTRFSMLLAGAFAVLALVLASVGIYGVMSYTVVRRAKEIGIRRALGAQESTVLWAIFKQGFLMAVIGLAIGAIGAFWITRLIAAMFPGPISPSIQTLLALVLVVTSVTSLACFLPAKRALRLNPVDVLRSE